MTEVSPGPLDNLCDVPSVLVGNATDHDNLTGCTAVIFERATVAGVDVRGSAPGTRETDSLDPTATAGEVHALLLTGGSAFGLGAADGVMSYLQERGRGLDTGVVRVPIVPAAVIFDLAAGSADARPDAEMGHAAASTAASEDFPQGNAGAGTGATVGKILGGERAMKGGLGSASVRLGDGLVVGALAVVNALGDVRDPESGRIVAGPRLDDGSPGDSVELLAQTVGGTQRGENTTLAVVATNASLTKPQATKVAQMAQDGLARAVYPAHTTFDGDTVFAAATGEVGAAVDLVGAWAARLVTESILRGVRQAASAAGIPSCSASPES